MKKKHGQVKILERIIHRIEKKPYQNLSIRDWNMLLNMPEQIQNAINHRDREISKYKCLLHEYESGTRCGHCHYNGADK